MGKKILKLNIYRRVLVMVLFSGIIAFFLSTTLLIYTLDDVKTALVAQGNTLSDSIGDFVWDTAQSRSKRHLTEVAETKARHIDRELALNAEDVVCISKMASTIMSAPENYRPRKLTNVKSGENIPLGQAFIHTSAALEANGISGEIRNEMEIASNIADTLQTMSYYYRDYQTSLYIGSKNGYFICVDVLPGKIGTGSTFPDEKIRMNFINKFDPRERPWYKLAAQEQKLVFTDTFLGASGELDIVCAMPYYDANGFAGVVGIGCTLADVYQQVYDTAIGDTGFSFALDNHGDVAFSGHKEGVLAEQVEITDLRQTEDPGLAKAANRMVAGESGVESIILDDKEYYLAFAPLKTIGWSFGTLIEKKEIKTNSNQIRDRIAQEMIGFQGVLHNIFTESLEKIAFLLIVLFLVCVYVGKRSAKHITTPIRQLTDGVREIAKGNLDKKVSVDTNDEIGELAERFNSMTDELKEYIKNLSEAAAEKQRAHTELEIAAKIQEGMLPDILSLKNHKEFDLHALMYPAKEVGGDFYDFYFIDEENLVCTVADVSGKGVPAALFMVIAKTLLKDHILTERGAEHLSKTIATVNDALSKSNPECMFVTTFVGILNLPTGRFTYVNAGHNPPLLLKRIKADTKGLSFEYLPIAKNPILGFHDGITFESDELTLSKGDTLFLYTDGVTEAMNDKKEMFSEERLKDTLNKIMLSSNDEKDAGEMLSKLLESVHKHIGKVNQYDDITMLGLVYRGK